MAVKPVLVHLRPTQPNRIEAAVGLPDGTTDLLFIEADQRLAHDGTPWVPAQLPIAMSWPAPLQIDAPTDPETIRNATGAQSVLANWYPEMVQVEVRAPVMRENVPPALGVGCFFSAGVDSFYSALMRTEEVTHLLFVHGFDIPLADGALGDLAREGARRAAKALGKPLIEIATNLRHLSDGRVHWQTHYHGAAMAAVGHALSPLLGRVIVPGSYSREDLHPWGTHPDLDPCWSGSRVQFEHDAVDVPRPEKIRELASHQVAMDHLRVCFNVRTESYNCGRCEKCVRTMLNLRAADALQRCRTLPDTIDARAVRRLTLTEGGHLFARENLRALRAMPGRDHALEGALRTAVVRGHVRRPLAKLVRAMRATFR